MSDWWNALDSFQRIYASVAITATFILAIQTILVIFGIGDGDGDFDFDTDFDAGIDGLSLFSIRGIASFFSIGAWTGYALSQTDMQRGVAILLSILAGTAALFAIAFIVSRLKRLQSDGTISMENAVGKVGTVYITVPANKARPGKIMVSFQGKLNECEAVTESTRDLKTGEGVEVTGLFDENTLIVKPQS